jgi:drug/metabolite transporter (DMT)-like permease
MNDKLRGTLEMTGAMIISGTIGWFVIKSGRPVQDVVFWRCLFGALSLLLVCAAAGLLKQRLTLRVFALIVLGGVAIVLNWLLLFAAYPLASISISTAVYSTQPFILFGLGIIFFSEKLTVAKLGWLVLAFAGVLAIVAARPSTGPVATDYMSGIALSLGAAFFYALASIITKHLKGTPPQFIALIQVCTGALMLAPFAELGDLPETADVWAILATLGLVHTGIMYILLYGAIQRLPTHLTGSLSFIYPVAAIFVDRIAFGHHLQPVQVVGAGAILFSAAAMNRGWSISIIKIFKRV